VTRAGGLYGEVSWDGRHLYYANARSDSGLWRVSLEGGAETEVVPGPIPDALDWALSGNGVYYAEKRWQGRRGEYAIQYLDFESGEVTELFRRDALAEQYSLAVSPDEEWILYAEEPRYESELMLMENFR